jgi:hypothetical protein
MSTHQNCDVTVGSHFGPFWEGHSEENAPYQPLKVCQRHKEQMDERYPGEHHWVKRGI